MLAGIIEPGSKLDSLRVLEEAGAAAASYRTVKRRLPADAKQAFRQGLSAACAAGNVKVKPDQRYFVRRLARRRLTADMP